MWERSIATWGEIFMSNVEFRPFLHHLPVIWREPTPPNSCKVATDFGRTKLIRCSIDSIKDFKHIIKLPTSAEFSSGTWSIFHHHLLQVLQLARKISFWPKSLNVDVWNMPKSCINRSLLSWQGSLDIPTGTAKGFGHLMVGLLVVLGKQSCSQVSGFSPEICQRPAWRNLRPRIYVFSSFCTVSRFCFGKKTNKLCFNKTPRA